MPKQIEPVQLGEIFGDWIVIGEATKVGNQYCHLCRCKCGREHLIPRPNLRGGKSKSCNKGTCKKISSTPCSEDKRSKLQTHGMTKTKLYKVWANIRKRVEDPVGRNECYSNVTICDAWNDFAVFNDWAQANGYKEGLSIDRIDGTGNYEPTNCRWTTALVQSQNRPGHKGAEIPFKGIYKAKPRNGKTLYQGTGKAPYYYIIIYNGERFQQWGFETAEAAYEAKCAHIKRDFDGLVYP